jgi:hypothetical protein
MKSKEQVRLEVMRRLAESGNADVIEEQPMTYEQAIDVLTRLGYRAGSSQHVWTIAATLAIKCEILERRLNNFIHWIGGRQ